jgi:MFS family permease
MEEYVKLLRANRNYRNLWLGSVITQLGDWFNLIASAELIRALTNSDIALSYLFIARFLPLFVFSPIAGVLADRYDRRRIMIITDLLRAGTVLAFLLIRSPGQIWLLYALTILQFSLSALFTPARTAVLANVVARKELVAANALDSLTWSTMLALGALAGGLVATLFGRNTAFVVDALTFAVSAWVVSRIVMPERAPRSAGGGAGGWLDFVNGFRYLWHAPFILVVGLAKAGGSLVWGSINVLEINFANEIFSLDQVLGEGWLTAENGSTASLTIIYLLSGLGTGLGPIFMRRWLGDRVPRLMIGITIGFGLLVLGIAGLSLSPGFAALGGATLVRTIGSGTIWVFSAALLQMLVPDAYRGRVFAFEFAMLTLTQSASILAAGYLQDSVGLDVRQTTAVMAALGVVIGTAWLAFYLFARKWARETDARLHSAVAVAETNSS